MAPNKRTELFLKKLAQCQVLFDFSDPSSDLKGKDIKGQALQDMLEYITTTKDVLTSAVYPQAIKMVIVKMDDIVSKVLIIELHY
jgi:serine/threonine-protein phosphatase 2A regulatory subunit B'